MLRIPTHPLRRAKLDRAVHDARVGAHVPKRRIPRVRAERPVPDPAELRERDVELRALALAFVPSSGVNTPVEVVQPRVDGLDERVARGRMRAEPVDVREEEGARVGGCAREDADLGEDYLGSGLKVGFTIGYARNQKIGRWVYARDTYSWSPRSRYMRIYDVS